VADGSDAFKFSEYASKTLAFDAPGYGAISGTAQPFTLVHVAAPYHTPVVDGNIWNLPAPVVSR